MFDEEEDDLEDDIGDCTQLTVVIISMVLSLALIGSRFVQCKWTYFHPNMNRYNYIHFPSIVLKKLHHTVSNVIYSPIPMHNNQLDVIIQPTFLN